MPRRLQPKKRHYRCRNCGTPIPAGYSICGMCGQDQSEPLPIRVNTLEELTREYNIACDARR